jgi:transposase
LVGVPVADATHWDQGEIVGDCTQPICKGLERLAAHGEVIFQDDTPGRVLALIADNQKARAQARAQGRAKPDVRTGRPTTALIVQVGARRICWYDTGRRHAGENLEARLTNREPGRDKPLVRSDALSSNNAEEPLRIRWHCLAHARRQFNELADDFPVERAMVVQALKLVYEPDDETREQGLRAQERLTYHQEYRVPVFTRRKAWLEQQTAQRLVAPKSRVGQAITSMLEHGETLTRVVTEPGAPLDNNVAERALQLAIRQRNPCSMPPSIGPISRVSSPA